MRPAVSLIIAACLLAPGSLAAARLPEPHWDAPAGSRAHLIPPQPGVQTWPGPRSQGDPILPPGPVQTTGTARVLVLLVDFTDTPPDATHTGAYFDTFFNDTSSGARSFRAYYSETSRGALTVRTTVIATWFHSAHPMSDYGADGPNPPDDANGPIYRLVTEAVQLADPTVDFAPFDTNGDGVVDHLTVVHTGGAQESGGSSDTIWSHRWFVLDANPTAPGAQSLNADGVQIYGYTMVGESSPVGVAAHEFGHDLGLPDVYDTDGSSEGAGIWEIMSGGSWNGVPAGTSPAHFSAWSKIRLGWVTPTDVVTSLVGTSIPEAETAGPIFRLGIAGTSPPESFLVENRQEVGFDAGLPGSGLLIWHVDDGRASNDVDGRRLLDLEEADEGVSGDRPTDASDPWRNSAAGWGPDTIPDSRAYSGADTGWRVREISASGPTMTATIAREVQKDFAVTSIRLPFTANVSTTVRVEIDIRNDGAQAGDFTLDLGVYRDVVASSSRVAAQTVARTAVAPQTTVTIPLNFTPASVGRYIVHAALVDAADEIPSNDERAAHALVNAFDFRDDVESGTDGWTRDGLSTDLHRWEIVNDTDPDGAAHSRTHSWRFGFVSTLLPSLFPPEWHTLTSPAVSVGPGPTFLVFYHRYDLTGRTVPALPIGSNDTDDTYVEVSYGGGPWIRMAHYAGRDLAWRGVSFDLSANTTGATTLRVRFNASANVMGNSGGWWIDDVMVAERGLGRAVVLLGTPGPYEGPAGGRVRITLKVANVGEYEADFRLDAALPAGWDATVEGGTSGPLSGRVVRVAPDNDLVVRISVGIPLTATSGALVGLPISATAIGDPNASASMTVQVRVSGIPLESIGIGIALVVVALILLVAIVVRRRRRARPPT